MLEAPWVIAPGFAFKYGDVVSILGEMMQNQRVSAMSNGARTAASFVLQELPVTENSIYSAPVIRDQSRPQSDTPGNVGMAR